MKVTNAIAQAVEDELDSSLPALGMVEYALVALHERDDKHGNRDAQIAAEALKRVMPDITPGEYVKVVSDILRWYCDGDCLDCTPDMRDRLCSHG